MLGLRLAFVFFCFLVSELLFVICFRMGTIVRRGARRVDAQDKKVGDFCFSFFFFLLFFL